MSQMTMYFDGFWGVNVPNKKVYWKMKKTNVVFSGQSYMTKTVSQLNQTSCEFPKSSFEGLQEAKLL